MREALPDQLLEADTLIHCHCICLGTDRDNKNLLAELGDEIEIQVAEALGRNEIQAQVYEAIRPPLLQWVTNWLLPIVLPVKPDAEVGLLLPAHIIQQYGLEFTIVDVAVPASTPALASVLLGASAF